MLFLVYVPKKSICIPDGWLDGCMDVVLNAFLFEMISSCEWKKTAVSVLEMDGSRGAWM